MIWSQQKFRPFSGNIVAGLKYLNVLPPSRDRATESLPVYHTTFSPTAAVGSCGNPWPGGSPRSVLTNPFGVRLAARAVAPFAPNGSPPMSSVSGPTVAGGCTGPCGARTSSSCSTSGATPGSAANTPPTLGSTGAEIIARCVSSHARLAGHCWAAWAAGALALAAAGASSELASRVVAAISRARREPLARAGRRSPRMRPPHRRRPYTTRPAP